MSVYTVTKLGEQELLNKKLNLHSRVRALLIILYSKNVPKVDIDLIQRIGSAENFQRLEDLDLIKCQYS